MEGGYQEEDVGAGSILSSEGNDSILPSKLAVDFRFDDVKQPWLQVPLMPDFKDLVLPCCSLAIAPLVAPLAPFLGSPSKQGL